MLKITKNEIENDLEEEELLKRINITTLNEREEKLGKNFKICFSEQLGKGGYGYVYKGYNLKTLEPIAIKVNSIELNQNFLEKESKILTILQGKEGIPKLYKYILEEQKEFLCMELLGKNIDELFIEFNRQFNISTSLFIGYNMFLLIQYIHEKHIIHRDINPCNFSIGYNENTKNKIYLIDYGWAKKIFNNKGKHIPFKKGKQFLIGTERFCSVYTHLGFEQSRRDDLESLLYIISYLLKGNLPWFDVHGKTKNDLFKKIMDKKMDKNICESLFENFKELNDIFSYVRTLDFYDKPDYDYINKIFVNCLNIHNIKIKDFELKFDKNYKINF